MKTQILSISPEIAKKLLATNKINRRPKTPVIKRYAELMKNGEWKEGTGEAIKISINGNLIDGQHRLMAIVLSNITLSFLYISELDESIFDVLDTGSIRNATDCFHIAGIKADKAVPSIIQFYYILKNGGTTKNKHVNDKKTNSQLLDLYYENPDMWDTIVRRSMNWYNNFGKILTPSTIGGFYTFFMDKNEIHATEFMSQLTTGIDCSPIINLLRNKLISDKHSPRKMPPYLKNALIIKTWNYYRLGVNPKILKYAHEIDNYPIAL